MPTQAILFDINETVLNLSSLKPKFLTFFGSESLVDTWFSMLLHSSTVCLTTQVQTNFKSLALVALKSLSGRLNIPITDENCNEILNTLANLPAHSDIKPALIQLRTAGIKRVAFSNSSSSLLNAQLNNAGLLDYFDHIISVEDAGTFKPALQAYHHAFEVLSLAPKNICLVATHDWDTHGALCAGLNAAYINRLKAPYNPLYKTPKIMADTMDNIVKEILLNNE